MEERRKYPQSAMGRDPGERRRSGMPGRREETMKCVYAGPGYFKNLAKTEGREDEKPMKKNPGTNRGKSVLGDEGPDNGENINV